MPHNKSLHPILPAGQAFASCSWVAANACPSVKTGELNRYGHMKDPSSFVAYLVLTLCLLSCISCRQWDSSPKMFNNNLPMIPLQSKNEFIKRLKANNILLENLTPAEGISQMIDFYQYQRARDCDLLLGADMLMYHCGVYIATPDDGRSATCIHISRYFNKYKENECFLDLCFVLATEKDFQKLGSTESCNNMKGVTAFRKYIEESPMYIDLGNAKPKEVILKLYEKPY